MLDLPTENPLLTKYLISLKYFTFESMFANNLILPTEQKTSEMALVERFLNISAPLDATDVNGQTLLMWASERGHTVIAALLLQQGANPELTDPQGETALIKAARNAKVAVVKLLLNLKVDTEKVDALGNTALAIVLNDYMQYSKRILEGGTLDGEKLDNKELGEIIKLLLHNHANPEVMLNTGTQQCTLWTAIVKSRSLGTDIWWINSLKRKKSDYSFDDEFAFACEHNFVHGVRALLKLKPEILERHKNCVSLAVKARHTELLGLLLAQCASAELKQELLNHRDEKGDTPLLIAFRAGGNARMAAHLLKNGDNLAKLDSEEGIKLYKLRSKSKEWKIEIDRYAQQFEKSIETPELIFLASQAVYRYAKEMQKPLNEFDLPTELVQLCKNAPNQLYFQNQQLKSAREFMQKMNEKKAKDIPATNLGRPR